MPKLSTIPVLFRENFASTHFEREPEPDLIMDEDEQVEAFTQAGKAGALTAVYAYNCEHATPVLQGCKSVIDLGCGSGVFLTKMARLNPETHFTGLDLSEPMLDRTREAIAARNLKNVEVRHQDFTDLSQFSDQSVDGVMSLQAFHHLPTYNHLRKTFTEVKRVLKPGGAIYFQDLIRLKRLQSVLHFAYYDDVTPRITQLDGERSMRAAFLYEQYVELAKEFLPPETQVFRTGGVGLYTVLKTPDREVSLESKSRLKAYFENIPADTNKIYKDIRLFHRLGGLK